MYHRQVIEDRYVHKHVLDKCIFTVEVLQRARNV